MFKFLVFLFINKCLRHLLASINRLDTRCVKECGNQTGESVRNFTLKSLINERLLTLDDQVG